MSAGKKPFELTLAAKPPAKETQGHRAARGRTVDPVESLCGWRREAAHTSESATSARQRQLKFDEAMKELQSKSAQGPYPGPARRDRRRHGVSEQVASWFAPGRDTGDPAPDPAAGRRR